MQAIDAAVHSPVNMILAIAVFAKVKKVKGGADSMDERSNADSLKATRNAFVGATLVVLAMYMILGQMKPDSLYRITGAPGRLRSVGSRLRRIILLLPEREIGGKNMSDMTKIWDLPTMLAMLLAIILIFASGAVFGGWDWYFVAGMGAFFIVLFATASYFSLKLKGNLAPIRFMTSVRPGIRCGLYARNGNIDEGLVAVGVMPLVLAQALRDRRNESRADVARYVSGCSHC